MRNQARAMGVAAAIALLLLSTVEISGSTLACPLDVATGSGGGTVEKRRGESFTTSVTLRNTGTTRRSWNVAVAFEGNVWNWEGNQRTLDLRPGKQQSLSWEGCVPEEAEVGSVARLVVYYDDSCAALDWWILVVSGETLEIVQSTVS